MDMKPPLQEMMRNSQNTRCYNRRLRDLESCSLQHVSHDKRFCTMRCIVLLILCYHTTFDKIKTSCHPNYNNGER